MHRRKFLKTSAGLFIAAAPAIIRPPSADAQLLNLKFGAPVPAPPGTSIPMSAADSRFAGNTPASRISVSGSGSLTNQTWDENPGYADGVSAFEWGSATGTYNLSLSKIDWREGIRVAGDGGATLNVDQCFINTVGFDLPADPPDHADGLQGFAGAPGGQVNLNVTNTCFRSYSDTEAQSIYGGFSIGSAGFFWADNMRGNITLNNVLIWGGERGIDIYADTGTTTINFQNVYIASSPNGTPWSGHDYDIRATGGTLTVANWTNVRAATVVGGVIVPGSLLPSP